MGKKLKTRKRKKRKKYINVRNSTLPFTPARNDQMGKKIETTVGKCDLLLAFLLPDNE